MRVHFTLLEPRVGRAVQLVLTAAANTTLDDIAATLGQVHEGHLFIGDMPLAGQATFAESGLRNGSVVTVGQPLQKPQKGDLELAVVGGPGSGASYSLPIGVVTVGSGPNADIQIPDRNMDRVHLKFRLGELDDHSVFDMHARSGIFIDGKRIEGRHDLAQGDVIRAGASLLEVRLVPDSNADIRLNDEGHLVFNRPARIWPTEPVPKVVIPSEPEPPEKPSFPWVMAIAPLVLSIGGFVVLKSPYFLLFGLMSPVMVVGSRYTTNKDTKRRHKKAVAKYEDALAKAKESIAESVRVQKLILRFKNPDPVNLESIAVEPRKRLWERRAHDPDFLFLRTGTVDQDANLKITARGADEEESVPQLHQVPTGIDLKTVGVLGIAGPPDSVRGAARWLIGQIAILHSPSDVVLWLLTDTKSRPHWEWLRWLPHFQFEDQPEAPFANIATDKYQRDEHVKALLRMVAARKTAMENDEPRGPAIVVVHDGMRELRAMPGVVRLLKDGPQVGIYSIGLDDDPTRLAEEGNAEVVVDKSGIDGSLHVKGELSIHGVLIDQVSGTWATNVARGLAPLREIEGDEGDRSLPNSVSLVDMLDLPLDEPSELLVRWSLEGRTTRAPIGISTDGVFILDLKHDGPHGLVAGTTGAGKSELLQTFVVSLAVANTPDAINFVLIDYKGASAFADCDHLPHTVGMVTNLDGHLTERALTALDAELKRREQVLSELRAPDIDVAWDRDPKKASESSLARLVIVIDEFAELVHELPEFVTGLIRVARVGRSLGVHLVLATQRPAGVVSAEMRSNTGLRIALRMEDRNDSVEVIEQGDAAFISRATPGRAFARLGGGVSLVPFQTARVAGRRKGVDNSTAPPEVLSVPWSQLGRPLPRTIHDSMPPAETTDLFALVELVNAAARAAGATKPRSPWLPPLPENFVLPPYEGNEQVVYGIEDRPADQAQPFATYDVRNDTHMVIAGSARSGRSTALRAIAAGIARVWSPSDCHIYGIDYGNGALLALKQLPHCGAVATRTESSRVERLVARLVFEVANRQEFLSYLGVGDIAEQRERGEDPLPYIVVFLDRWDAFTTDFSMESGSDMVDLITRLLREGPGVGVRLILSGDRALLNDRISNQIDQKLVLRLNERDDYRLAGINPRKVAEVIPAGRAMRGASMIEVQFALLDADVSGPAQAKALADIAAEWRRFAIVPEPFRVDLLPVEISIEAALAATSTERLSPFQTLVGIGGDELAAIEIDILEDGPVFTVAGVSKSGRSTALLSMALSLIRNGVNVVAFTPKTSPLTQIREIVPVFVGLNNDIDEIQQAFAADDRPAVAIVDDATFLNGTTVDQFMQAAIKARSNEFATIIAGRTEDLRSEIRGFAVEARKGRLGMILSPQSALEGDLFGLRLPRSFVGKMPPGRAVLARHGEAMLIQVPLSGAEH